jgi:cytochrome P450
MSGARRSIGGVYGWGRVGSMAADDFPHASLVEGIRFTAQVAVPNVIQGLLRRRRTAVAAATRVNADGLAAGFVAGLRRSYGDGPLWIRVAKDEVLLMLGRDAVARALDNAPDPYAADPEPKRSAMAHFQPHALTISRGEAWRARRQFTESVLATGEAEPPYTARAADVAREEAAALTEEFDWPAFNGAVRSAARRIILGDGAGADGALSDQLGELMDKSNPPGGGDDALRDQLTASVAEYVAAAEPGSLAARFAAAPGAGDGELDPPGQLIHWLFALGDTLAINAFRCLAVLAGNETLRRCALGDAAFADSCLQEAMRLWPTTPMLAREAVHDADWDGVPVPAGTQLMIVNLFNHRDRDAVERADEFWPERWLADGAAADRQFNHFSHGPQGCPGVALSLLVGRTMLHELLAGDGVRQTGGTEVPVGQPMPRMLDFFGLQFARA